ncbi:hypothetical protein VKT23_008124 [Stygiomarasmius scandens]|uniref:Integrase core domain-containing protein n=1 Tax=Marasmiellus scandens TaxID=2682957 RepID=A0ABR1JHY4_9AGAR
MPNQYKPNPPLDLIRPWMEEYWAMDWDVKKIWIRIRDHHIDKEEYGIGSLMKEAGLLGVRAQGHTAHTIKPYVENLRTMYPKAGLREMKSLLKHELGVAVARDVLWDYFHIYESHLIKFRKGRNLVRKQFWSAGVNDIWAFDQHDKWKYKFGLALHVCVDPFSGYILWLKIWWTNSNPVLILSYYTEVVEETGYVCLVTQSDLGTENVGIANAHTVLRQLHDPTLQGTIQHRYMAEKKNVMPEIEWSQLRRRWTPGWEDLLDWGVQQGWYSVENELENFVFRWIFIPLLQRELDLYRTRKNYTAKRKDKNKILPHGVPADINRNPKQYNSENFSINVNPEHLESVKAQFIPEGHAVFDLVPPSFNELISNVYEELGKPEVNRSNVWNVYCILLERIRDVHAEDIAKHAVEWKKAYSLAREENWETDKIVAMEGRPLIEEEGYLGGVNGGLGILDPHTTPFQIPEQPELILDFPEELNGFYPSSSNGVYIQ